MMEWQYYYFVYIENTIKIQWTFLSKQNSKKWLLTVLYKLLASQEGKLYDALVKLFPINLWHVQFDIKSIVVMLNLK